MNIVAIAVFEGAEELDFVGPWEVLTAWRHIYPDDIEVCLVGETTEPVTCAKGMRVLPDRTWDDLRHIDLLIYPGGRGTRAQLGDERIRSRLRGARPTDVAARLGISKQALNYLLRELERLGYLEREPDPDDLRSKRIVITKRGIAAVGVIRDAVAEMETSWARQLGPKRFTQLRNLLLELQQPT